ncbi:ATP phosphoribosyltransferase regulatory subunit [Staphylococcus pasteuri]|uniref:ATP phosphoribosyltransferase regulatory subunit n=1 Tax=Staphylococcus pasteuri TaxID=45972 RepID=UPI0012B7B357|nr:ATP phosphoribosyltransferase regulatory subunit [Staphylococcus pasteuri]
MNKQNQIIKIKEIELAFLKYFSNKNYKLVDIDLIEKLDWSHLTKEDLLQMKERNFWQNNNHIYSLRHDFTDQLLRYHSIFPTDFKKVAYSGPIVRNNEVISQIGIENYLPIYNQFNDSFNDFYHFIKTYLKDDIQLIILGHYQLLNELLEEKYRTLVIKNMIEERNLSGLKHQLPHNHPILKLLSESTRHQLSKLSQYLDQSSQTLLTLKSWEEQLIKQGLTNIHLDISAQPSRSYYKGVFIRCYLNKHDTSLLTGGFYSGDLQGYGMALTL